MMAWTVVDVLAEGPCLSRAEIEQYFGDKESLTLQEILGLHNLSDEYKFWMACRPGAISQDIMSKHLEVFITRAVTNHALHCGIEAVEEWAVAWLDGSDRSPRSAWGAARTATCWAAAHQAAASAMGAKRLAEKAPLVAITAWVAQADGVEGYHQQVMNLQRLLGECKNDN